MYKDHPLFTKPSDAHAKIWRYMDFTKFVSLLSTTSLYFNRSDRFADPFEGSFPKANVIRRPQVYSVLPHEIQASTMAMAAKIAQQARRSTAINCWHCCEYESAAMWDIYGKFGAGISIQSTYQRLADSLEDHSEDDVFIGLVKYIDYESEMIPESNILYPFLHKRKSFEHERELRAVILRFPITETGIDFSKESFPDGLSVPVRLDTIVESVHVSPTAPSWFLDLVGSVMAKFSVNKNITKSSLADDPVW